MPQSLTNLVYHVVFSTKYREPLITDELQEPLYQYLGGVVRNGGGRLLEIGGMPDHVHLLTKLRPDKAMATEVGRIKAVSSRWMSERLAGTGRRFAWQRGYGAFSVSESRVEVVRRYIQTQEEHHAEASFEQEMIGLLHRHGVAYDLRDLRG